MWEAKRLLKRAKIHPDYYRASIQGEWAKHVPMLTAFGMELHHLNQMSQLMGRLSLFKRTFDREDRPRGFALLIRPTLKEFNDFVLLLDQAMSDNINKSFFGGDVALEKEETRRDGKVIVTSRGTISLLEEWLRTKFRTPETKPLEDAIAIFRRVRKLRQSPAHTPYENNFDQQYFKDQRELVWKAYTAVRTLRLIFQNHPACKAYKVEDFLHEGRIRDF